MSSNRLTKNLIFFCSSMVNPYVPVVSIREDDDHKFKISQITSHPNFDWNIQDRHRQNNII